MMFSTTFKRPLVALAVVGGLLIAAAPASAGSHQAATDGTSNTLINSVVGDSHRGQAPTGFSWSETQTGLANTAGRPTATRTNMYVPTSAEVITTAQERGAAAGFKSLSGMDSETEFMDYTDDALLDSVGTTGLKFETEITDYLQRRTASGIDVWGLDRGVFSGDAYDNEMGITTQASIARPNSEIRPR